jgi:hypothetical protein
MGKPEESHQMEILDNGTDKVSPLQGTVIGSFQNDSNIFLSNRDCDICDSAVEILSFNCMSCGLAFPCSQIRSP